MFGVDSLCQDPPSTLTWGDRVGDGGLRSGPNKHENGNTKCTREGSDLQSDTLNP